ncbi:hypothetical protein [Dialister hominis]|uniref:hypothetical protein n=1 Tax=Dialister hominis TaxID=2582419 RepID=UPI003AB6D486
MDLRNYFDQLTPEKRVMQFGRKTDEPLRLAFDSKRVVHAAMGGSMVPPPMAQKVWRDIMAKPVEGHPTQMAYIHIPFCKTKCLYCPFFQNGTNQDEEDRYIDHLVKDIEMGADSPRLSSAPIQAAFFPRSRDVCRLPMTTNSPSKAVCMTSSRRRWTYGSETA